MNTNQDALPHSLEGLLTHADWVRALARRLVRDDAEADDVAQEVWREAVERPPRHDANPRGWLAAVARNAARAMKRGDRRRGDRERATARSEALPSTTQLVEEASLSRELAGIVLQLDEPYRTTMLLRWFREMEVDAIAEAQKMPRETVRTRLRRGLEMLREKLDAERGGRTAWLSAFVPLTRVELLPSTAASGAIGGTGLWISLAAASLAVTTWIVVLKPFDDRSEDKVVAYGQDEYGYAVDIHGSGKQERLQPTSTPESNTSSRTTVVAAGSTSSNPVPTTEPERTIEARIVDVSFHPIEGFVVEYRLRREPYWEDNTLHTPSGPIEVPPRLRELLLEHRDGGGLVRSDWPDDPGVWETLTQGTAPRPSAASDANGLIRIELPRGEWDRRCADEKRGIVAVLPQQNGPATWVVASCIRVGGIVVDETDRPLTDAQVQLTTRWRATHRGNSGEPAALQTFSSGLEVDAFGGFTFDCVPFGVPSTLGVRCDGYERWGTDAPDHDERALKIVLKRAPPSRDAHVRGVVLDADGRPFADVEVQLGQFGTRPDEHGRFDLKVTCCVDGMPLTASKRGHQPAILLNFGRAKLEDVDGVVLRLGGKPLAITGHVLEADGRPIPDCFIRLVEATQYGTTDLTIEALSSDSNDVRPKSSADGAFEIGGLLDREYTLIAWHEERGFIARKERVAAGASGVELKLDPSVFVARLPGSLVDGGGEPVAGARVKLSLNKLAQPWSLTYGSVTTGADGRFVLENVPVREVGIWIEGDSLETITVPMPEDAARGIRLVAKLLVPVRLNVADESVASIEFRDRDDQPCKARIHLPDLVTQSKKVARVDGAFPPFDLGEAAVEAVLMRADGTIVRRAPIAIRRAKELALDL